MIINGGVYFEPCNNYYAYHSGHPDRSPYFSVFLWKEAAGQADRVGSTDPGHETAHDTAGHR